MSGLALIEPLSDQVCPSMTADPAENGMVAIEKSLFHLTKLHEKTITPLFREVGKLYPPPPGVKNLAARFDAYEELEEAGGGLTATYGNLETRRHRRISCFATSTAVLIDHRGAPLSAHFMTSIRDISIGGLRLLHTRSITVEFMVLSWKAETLFTEGRQVTLSVILRLQHCSPLSPFYSIGGEFLTEPLV